MKLIQPNAKEKKNEGDEEEFSEVGMESVRKIGKEKKKMSGWCKVMCEHQRYK